MVRVSIKGQVIYYAYENPYRDALDGKTDQIPQEEMQAAGYRCKAVDPAPEADLKVSYLQ